MNIKLRASPAAVFAVLVSGCGGGSEPATPVPPTPTSGKAVDGYLSFARVTCDSNDNGIAEGTEPFVFTIANGTFTFPNGCTHGVIATGGTSLDTGLPFTGQLKAPAGATMVTPLTTLVSAGMTAAQVATALGLPAGTDVTKVDPAALASDGSLVNADLYKKTLAVQQLLQKVSETFTGLASTPGSGAMLPVYDQVAKSFANALKAAGASALVIGSGASAALDSTMVNALVKQASIDVGSSTMAELAAIKTAVAAQNAEALAVATSASLKAQADSILKAVTTADVVGATTIAQNDTKLVAAIVTNKDKLVAAPTTATADLGNLIKNGVIDPNTTSVQTNYLALANNAMTLVNGSKTLEYTMSQLESSAGIAMSWPLASDALLKFKISEMGSFNLAPNQRLSAAVQIEQTTADGKGLLKGFIDNVIVTKTGSEVSFLMSNSGTALANSLVYGVSADAKTKAIVGFNNAIRGVTNKLTTLANSTNSVLVGDVVSYAVNQVSNDFTGINGLRGKYKITLVVTDLPLRKLDGTQFKTYTIDVPTKLDALGAVSESRPVSGAGLQGYITLTD
jgi:hypothetical protein